MNNRDGSEAGEASRLPRAETQSNLPVVALIGRTNTGKSTLFNRLTRSRRAVVASVPGVTRDRNFAVARYGDRKFIIVDTGGFEEDEREPMGKAVQAQSVLAARDADAAVVLVDGRAGLNPLDAGLVKRLRGAATPLFLAVNKIDTEKQEYLPGEFYSLGADVLYPVSAEHGLGVAALMDAVFERLPEAEEKTAEAPVVTAVAIIGRPNVGKSSLLNRLVGFERAIVTPTAGTTRDAIDTDVLHEGRQYLLVDTAGIRRRPKVRARVERASVVRALRATERAEVALLVVDASEGMAEQDARVAGYAWERGRALVLVINKWDLVPSSERKPRHWTQEVNERFPSLVPVPKLFISALTGGGVKRIWGALDRVAEVHRVRIPTSPLNQVITAATRRNAPPIVRGKRPRLFYATQTATSPPSITVFASFPERIGLTYRRYLVNQIRAGFPLEGTPVRLRFRARERRGDGQKRRRKSVRGSR